MHKPGLTELCVCSNVKPVSILTGKGYFYYFTEEHLCVLAAENDISHIVEILKEVKVEVVDEIQLLKEFDMAVKVEGVKEVSVSG